LPKEIVIQSWRGNESFYSSVKKGYKAILSYGYYIDLIQPAAYHYMNDPMPDSVQLTEQEKKLILGGEATMWSELITPTTVDSRIWPRTAAIAERLWSPKSVNNIDDMYRRLAIISLQLESLGLKHIAYKQPLMRQLCNGYNITALETLTGVLEPLKIYDRNEGDTMYTVFSPLTKLADIASPDQPVPRIFTRQVTDFLVNHSASLQTAITSQLTLWKENDIAFRQLLLNAPVLEEASLLSQHLSLLAAAGLQSMEYIRQQKIAGNDWFGQQQAIIKMARQQGGRCEIQVVDAIQQLVEKAAGK
jgi:hexosaminidase